MSAAPQTEIAYFTTEEVAESFGVHVNTVRSWVRDGKIAAVVIARTVRIPAEALQVVKNPFES